MAKVTEDGMVLPILRLRLSTAMLVMYACLMSRNEAFSQLPWYCISFA